MNIINKTYNYETLSNIAPGSVFEFDDNFYIATDSIDSSKRACVNLDTGEIRMLYNTADVIRRRAEVTITNIKTT